MNIEELKQKYGQIKTVEIPLDEDDAEKKLVFHCKRPDKVTRKMISDLSAKGVSEGAVIAGFKSLRVAGDEVDELLKHEDALLIAEEALVTLLQVQKATIKKN